MSRLRFLQEESILEELEAEYESSCSETEDVENVSIHGTNSEEDADPVDHQPRELSPFVQPLGVKNWRDLQVSHDYLENVPLQFLRCGEFTGKDNTTKWQVCAPPQNVRTRSHNIVLALPGPIREGRNCSSIVEAWNHIFPPEFIAKIVIYTNIYIEKHRDKYRLRDSKLTNEIELRALFGLLYFIGRLRGAHLNTKDLWALGGTGCMICIATMSRKRFLFLLRSIRFDDIETRGDRRALDKFAPLREIYEDFNANIKKYYSLGPHVTIDEKLEKTRGRCPFRQYNPSKPGKYGAKLHLMADSTTYYTYNMEPYVGANEGPYNLSNSAADFVKRLVTPIRGSHRNVVTDNWYTSLPLSQDLLHEYGLTSLGTIRKNKPQIPAIFSATQRREDNSSIFGFQNDCTLVSYVPRKNKVVLLVSTMHHDATIDQESGEKKKPEMITDYNRYKCGVDVVDELCGTYSVSRITKRWPLVIFYGFMNIAGINAYIIAKQNKENSGQICDPRRDCLKELALALILPLVRQRQLVTNLPKEIKKNMELVVGIEEPVLEAAHRAPLISSSSRCSVCTWKKTVKPKHLANFVQQKSVESTQYQFVIIVTKTANKMLIFIVPSKRLKF